MDGRLALLFFAVGLFDMKTNDCETGCLARTPAQQAISLSFGDVIFQENTIGREAFGATHTTRFWESRSGAGAYAQLHFMPGFYAQGSGPDLGLPLEFRSGAEIGYQAKNGVRMGVSYDHRSNGDISSVNPGLETLQFRVTVPLN